MNTRKHRIFWGLLVAAALVLGGLMMMGVFDKEPTPADETAYWHATITIFPDRETALEVGYAACEKFEAGQTIGEVWPTIREQGYNEMQIDTITIALDDYLCPEAAEKANTR